MTAAHGRPLRVVPDPGETVKGPAPRPLARTAPTSLSPKPGKPSKFSTNGIPNTN